MNTTRRWPTTVALLMLTAGLVSGCGGGVRVRRVPLESLFHVHRENVLTSGQPSPRTDQFLRRHDLDIRFHKDPITVLEELDARIRREPDPDALVALAELCFLTARKAEPLQRKQALALYGGTVVYTYFYLFDEAVGTRPDPFDSRFRLVCDLYNRSLARCIALAQKQQLELKDNLHVDFGGGGLDIRITRHGFPEGTNEVSKYLFADDYEVLGLNNHYRTDGLGVPLIALRASTAKEKPKEGQERFFAAKSSYPVTAFLRVRGKLTDPQGPVRSATLELYDPLHIREIKVAGRPVPLESDLTKPLGYYLSEAKLEQLALPGLLRGGKLQDKAGLYMAQPYEPGKIPVVFVHGLWSTPMAWMQMYNDLLGDERLRQDYQFWFFMYPTGNPFPYSASLLRQALTDARKTFDPEGKDPALGQMVLVGHSMGGLLSKMMIQRSEEKLWAVISNKPVEQIEGDRPERDYLKKVYFYEPQPFVRRVIFIATPHQGSDMSEEFIGRLSSNLIALPTQLVSFQKNLLERNRDAFLPTFAKGVATSVDNLSPKSPILQTVASLPLDPAVKYHSIIGVEQGEPPPEGSDGVVPYKSAHLEGAESELVVECNHNAQLHPRAVLEVRRILFDHLDQVEATNPVIHARNARKLTLPDGLLPDKTDGEQATTAQTHEENHGGAKAVKLSTPRAGQLDRTAAEESPVVRQAGLQQPQAK